MKSLQYIILSIYSSIAAFFAYVYWEDLFRIYLPIYIFILLIMLCIALMLIYAFLLQVENKEELKKLKYTRLQEKNNKEVLEMQKVNVMTTLKSHFLKNSLQAVKFAMKENPTLA